jgi:hypothetical protein
MSARRKTLENFYFALAPLKASFHGLRISGDPLCPEPRAESGAPFLLHLSKDETSARRCQRTISPAQARSHQLGARVDKTENKLC